VKTASGNLFLVGLMGAGKSTVGRHLAERLGKRFIDADRVLEERCGVPIPVIFDVEGEAGFRRREAALIEELTQESDVVLATGGGAIENENSRRALMTRGVTVYLSGSASELSGRTRNDRNRPLLRDVDVKAKLEELLSRREGWYREVADVVIETGRPSVAKLAVIIIEALRMHPSYCEVVEVTQASMSRSDI
jgi:shikimate kinase